MTKGRLLSSIEPISSSVGLAEHLREQILRGCFPPGEQINESLLVKQLGVSRTPLREALQRLAQEGLLTAKRNHGMFMVELTKADVNEIYGIRKTLELTAVEAIISQRAGCRQEVRDRLVDIALHLPDSSLTPDDWISASRLDLQFHTALVKAAGNSRLLRAYSTLAAETLICMANIEQTSASPRTPRHDHLAMAELIATGSLAEIRSAFDQHLTASGDELVAGFDARSPVHRTGGLADS